MTKEIYDKKIFLIMCADEVVKNSFVKIIESNIIGSKIYFASDAPDALSKMNNHPPHIIVSDQSQKKMDHDIFLEKVIQDKRCQDTAVILLGDLPEEQKFLDDLVTGRLHYLELPTTDKDMLFILTKALNFAFHGHRFEYYLKFLPEGQTLMKQNETAEHVYLVKKGRLSALATSDTQKPIVLGYIEEGEFVGEMAYIDGQPRSATVVTIETCELIQIPIGTLERVLFRKPAWTKALMKTLSKRVKIANQRKF